MNDHFITEIHIKDFKCFDDFKADGFAQVNLIGGKNNVGKTAFMEACFLSRAISTEDLYKKLLEIETHRNIINNLLSLTGRQQDLQQLIRKNIFISILTPYNHENYDEEKDYSEIVYSGKVEIKNVSESGVFHIYTRNMSLWRSDAYENQDFPPEKYSYSELINILDVSLKNTKHQYSLNFTSPYSNINSHIIDIIDQFKLNNKYNIINKYLKNMFGVSEIDTIKNKPMLKIKDKYHDLSTFGQGIKSFINIIGSMLLLEKSVFFIDEIENGIHFTHFDELWKIILTLSKEREIQVFATTHSKECIESFNRTQIKLKNKKSSYFEMGRSFRTHNIFMRELDNEQLEYELTHQGRYRGE